MVDAAGVEPASKRQPRSGGAQDFSTGGDHHALRALGDNPTLHGLELHDLGPDSRSPALLS